MPFRCNQAVAFADQLPNFCPLRRLIDDERYPALLPAIWSLEVARLLNKQLLQRQSGFETDTKMPFIRFKDSKGLRSCLEGGMAPRFNFVSFGKIQADLAQLRQDSLFCLFVSGRFRQQTPTPFPLD